MMKKMSRQNFIFSICLAVLLFFLIVSPAAAVPPSDGNFWYQTILIESDTATTNNLYHLWVEAPYNWSNGNYDSYRLYYENGTSVPFHIFSANGTHLSLSFKGNLVSGNNTFYLSAGNESLSSVQTTNVYDSYTPLEIVTNGTTYNTNNYNFVQSLGSFTSNSTAQSRNGYVQYTGSSNQTFRTVFNVSGDNECLGNITYNGISLESMNFYSSGRRMIYYNAVDSINTENTPNLYSTVYTPTSQSRNISIDSMNTESQSFKISNIFYFMTANITVYSSYSGGNYSIIQAYSVSNPEPLINDFLVVSWVDLRTKSTIGINGQLINTSSIPYSSGSSTGNIQGSWNTTTTLAGTLSTSSGNYTINNWTASGSITNTSIMNARAGTFVLPVKPSTISLVRGVYANASIPLDFHGNQLLIPYIYDISFGIVGRNNIVSLVIDSDGYLVDGATTEYYLYASQFEGSSLTTDFGISLHNASSLTNYAVYAEARNYGNDTVQVVTKTNNTTANLTGALLVLEPKNNVTITVRDYDSLEIVSNYTAYLGENQRLKSTDNGTVEYDNVTNGIYDIVLVSDGYNQVTRKITVTTSQKDFVLYMTKSENGSGGGGGQVTTPQYITYYVRNLNNIPLPNTLVSVYEENGTEVLMSKMTGSDGAVTFTFNRTLTYNVVFEYGGVNESVRVSGSQSSYYVVYLNVSTPGPDVSLQDRLRSSMRVSSVNDTTVVISAMIVDDLVSMDFTGNVTYSVNPAMTQQSVQYGTGYIMISYEVNRATYDSWAEVNQKINFTATVVYEGETANLSALLTIKTTGYDLIDLDIPDNVKQGAIVAAAVLLVLGTASYNTASISYVAAMVPLLFGNWIGWVTIPVPILILLIIGLVLVIMYDLRKQDK